MPIDPTVVPTFNVGNPVPTAPLQLNIVQRLLLRLVGVNPSALISPVAAPTPPGIPDSSPQSFSSYREWERSLFFVNRERLLRYQEYDEMDYGDIASQLDVILDSVLVSDDAREQSFKVEIADNRNINNLCQSLIETTGLQSKMRQFLRAVLKYGDAPIALWFDYDSFIVGTQLIDPYFMRRRIDRYGRLLGGFDAETGHANAYWQTDYVTGASGGNEVPIRSWMPWQMIWLRWRESDRFVYSEGSYVEDMRKDWLKLRYSEASLPIARVSRAYPRRVMFLDVTGQTQDQKAKSIKTFREQLGLTELRNADNSGNIIAGTQARNPLSVADDIYVGTAYRTGPDGKLYPQLNSVQLEDPRIAGLENVGDLEYQRRKLYRRLSAGMMGDGKPVNDMGPQELAAAAMFQYCAWILEYRLIRPLLSLQCALRGYILTDKEINVQFANKTVKGSWRFSDAAFRASMADLNALAAGTKSVRQIMEENDQVNEADWERHVKQLEVEQELRMKGILPPIGKTATGTADGGVATKTGDREPPNPAQARKGANSG